ncbi:hypothetical protein MW871_15900 [Flavobacterium sp. I-SCBP12n]|uniref:Uncharacterized protein n=1 Tax=Flavobacterium pygoscelis TaxID=2893176 RepID=A0A9X1XTV6_9FLAO|nr:hypothetical protein [Flavobacterium pygoscelis]MCK8143375.1 hypothetical protein [Flavobacterium pygoscelis]
MIDIINDTFDFYQYFDKNQKKELFEPRINRIESDFLDADFQGIVFPSNFIIEENNTNFIYDENKINQTREEYLNTKITPILISLLKYEDVEYGIKSEGEKIIREQIELNCSVALNWINDLYITSFNDDKVLLGLVKIIGNIEENIISSIGQVIALASLSHRNNEIKELGVRAFENWASPKSYSILSNLNVGQGWLQDYINQVVKDLEVDLCLSL